MAKPKPTEKIVRVNFTLPESLKEEWDNFSRNTLQCSTSQMVRNAVRDYRLKYTKLEQPQVNPELELMKMKLEQSIKNEMNKFKEDLKNESNKIEDIEEIKNSILSILEIKQPMRTKEIARVIRLSPDKTLDILDILQQRDKIIKNTKDGWMIQ